MPFLHGQGKIDFTGPGYGYSEIYWPKGVDYASALASMHAVAAARLQILSSDIVMQRVSVSDVAVSGDIEADATYPLAGAAASPVVFPWIRIMMKWLTNIERRSMIKYVGGVPSIQFTGTAYLPTVGFAAAVAAYIAAVTANCDGRVKTKPPPVPPIYPFTFIALGAGAIFRVVEHRTGRPFGQLRGRRPIR